MAFVADHIRAVIAEHASVVTYRGCHPEVQQSIKAFSTTVLALLATDAAVPALFLATFIISALAATILLTLFQEDRRE